MLWENHQSMAVVIDEYSGTYGVLTSEDIVREIFGPITDEYKPFVRKTEIPQNAEKNEIDGICRLIDLNEQLGTNLHSDMVETIGGYICEKLGSIPKVGQSITADEYKFTVSQMDDKRVAKVLVHLEKKSECEEGNE